MRGTAFAVVGALGFVVQIGTVAALTRLAGWNAASATAAAVELAVLHNFLWHERWTWADRIGRGATGAVRRLARFHLANGATSMGANVLGVWAAAALFGLDPIAANVAAVVCTGALNFITLDRWVFLADGVREGGVPSSRRDATAPRSLSP
ncbi:MAG: GtrA family protein [Betaproteobacteria bacterium]